MRMIIRKARKFEIKEHQPAIVAEPQVQEVHHYKKAMQDQAYYMADGALLQEMQVARQTKADICTYGAMYSYIQGKK